jgi:hypothetical protein
MRSPLRVRQGLGRAPLNTAARAAAPRAQAAHGTDPRGLPPAPVPGGRRERLKDAQGAHRLLHCKPDTGNDAAVFLPVSC